MTLQFTPEWKTTLLALVLLPLLLRLGFWQLEREQEKRLILAEFEARQTQPHQDIAVLWQAAADQLAFRRVSARGHFDTQQVYLLDNKTRAGRVGYEVIQKLHLAYTDKRKNASALWVNRGWVKANARREQLPTIVTPEEEQTLLAEVYVPQGKAFKLAADALSDEGWPRVIQQLETIYLQERSQGNEQAGTAVFPYSLRLQAGSPAALVTDWQPVNVQPLKHRGYAIQWFAMAAALFVFYSFMSSNLTDFFRRPRSHDN